MKFRIDDENEIELVYSFRTSMYFEQVAGHSLDLQNMTDQDVLWLLFSIVHATLQINKMDTIMYVDFLNAVDKNGGNVYIYNFTKWFINEQIKQYELLKLAVDEDEDQGKKKKQEEKS